MPIPKHKLSLSAPHALRSFNKCPSGSHLHGDWCGKGVARGSGQRPGLANEIIVLPTDRLNQGSPAGNHTFTEPTSHVGTHLPNFRGILHPALSARGDKVALNPALQEPCSLYLASGQVPTSLLFTGMARLCTRGRRNEGGVVARLRASTGQKKHA